MAFTKKVGFIDAGKDDGKFAQIDRVTRNPAWRGQVPALYWIHDFLSRVISNYLSITARHSGLRTFAAREIESRKQRCSDRRDNLDQLFEVQKDKPEEMDDANFLSMATTNINAGSDNTAMLTRAIICHLLKSPECKKQLIEELNMQKGEGPAYMRVFAAIQPLK